MPAPPAAPRRLYKYKAFNATTLELLIEDKVYYADPSSFNDPLDTRPTLEPDLEVPVLEQVLEELVSRRISAEMHAAARTIRYKGPKTMEHIERLSRRQGEKLISEIAYLATNPDYEAAAPGPQKWLLAQHIERELLRQYDKGILSLAKRYACPLMWSHYGDQHRGICFGYSVPEAARNDIHWVRYGGSRLVQASRVQAMLGGDALARNEVDEGVLLRKASDWRYEKEWRHLGLRGLADSPLELEEVIFGARCMPSVRHAVRKALEGRARSVRFFQMREVKGQFKLIRSELDEEDMMSEPRRALSILEGFRLTDV